MNYTFDDLEAKKKELNSLIDDYFAISKHDDKQREELIAKINSLQNEVQLIYNKLKSA